MKAEHRRELKTNALADTLGKTLQHMREAPSRGTVIALSALIVAAVLYIVWTLVSQHTHDSNSELWEQWRALDSPSELDKYAKEHDKTVPGRLARFRSARLDLRKGLDDFGSPTQRNQALESLRSAAQAYEGLVDESARQPLLQQEAMLNSARAYETLGEVDRARSLFTHLKNAFPNSLAGREAVACLERLDAGGKDLETIKALAQQTGSKPISNP